MVQFKKYLEMVQESVIIGGKTHNTFNFDSNFYKQNHGKESFTFTIKKEIEVKIPASEWAKLEKANYSLTEPIKAKLIIDGNDREVRSLSEINRSI
jgi:hypothetical protein